MHHHRAGARGLVLEADLPLSSGRRSCSAAAAVSYNREQDLVGVIAGVIDT
jgi:hypothetical protein